MFFQLLLITFVIASTFNFMQLHSTQLSAPKFVAFFILVIGYEFVHFDPQLINKRPISLIPPLLI